MKTTVYTCDFCGVKFLTDNNTVRYLSLRLIENEHSNDSCRAISDETYYHICNKCENIVRNTILELRVNKNATNHNI